MQDVRGYIVNLLLEFVFVHNELSSTNPPEMPRLVISALLDDVVSCFLFVVRDIDGFPSSGAAQLLFELDMLKSVLNNFLTKGSIAVLDQLELLLGDCLSQDCKCFVSHPKKIAAT